MRVISVTNQKGGVGKTTTTVNLGAALGEYGLRVLVIDLDPQASASRWFGTKDEDRGLLDVFTNNGRLADIVRDTGLRSVSLVPSSAWLLGTEKALSGEVGAETILRNALDRLPDSWDYVLIDCPPALGNLTVNALTAADGVIVPVEAHVMALEGLAALLRTVDTVRARLNDKLKIDGLLACRVDLRTRLSQDIVQSLRERFGKDVFKVFIRENVRIAEAPSFALPITVYDRRSHGAEDYTAAAMELWKRTGKPPRQRTRGE